MKYTIEDVKKVREAFDKADKYYVDTFGNRFDKYVGAYDLLTMRRGLYDVNHGRPTKEGMPAMEIAEKLGTIAYSLDGLCKMVAALKNETDEQILETLNKKPGEKGYNKAMIGAMNCMPLYADFYNKAMESHNYNDKIVGYEDASLLNRFNNSLNEAEKLAGKSEMNKGKDNKENSFYKLIYKPLQKVQELGAVGVENMTAKESSEYEKSMRELKNCIAIYKNKHNPWFETGKNRLAFAKSLDKVLDVELEKMDEFAKIRIENMATLDKGVANKELADKVVKNKEVKEAGDFEVISFKSIMKDMVKNNEIKAPKVNDDRIRKTNKELFKAQLSLAR